MTSIKYDIKCPKCNHKNRFKVNNTFSESFINDIINKNIFKLVCSNCKQEIMVEYPFKVVGSNYVIYYTPTLNQEIDDEEKEYMRVCDTFEDLKEKILILNDNLNDIVIEFIKEFLLNNLDEELKSETTDIRYNGINKETIEFSLIGAKKIIGCNKDFYFKIVKKLKTKPIKKCVLIDKYTYKKYYKMRLI